MIFYLFLFFNFLTLERHPSAPCDSSPAINKKIIEFVNLNMNKKVGRGECWDLAAQALNNNKAKWDGRLNYGVKLDYKSECIYPGDVVQFDRVILEGNDSDGEYRAEITQHTAIIYEVKSNGNYIMAHQNYNNKKKVGLTPLNMNHLKKGKVIIYRPQI